MEGNPGGLFIVFEGLDGAGTTTQTKILADRLAALRPGLAILASAEPSSGPAGAVIRQVLRHRIRGTDCFGDDREFDPGALALLFAADRLDHYSTEIRPVLNRGGVAISDRYKLSSLAYQALGMPLEWVASINSMAPDPDIMFFLEVSPETAWQRVSHNRVRRDIFEVPDLLRRVHETYRQALSMTSGSDVVIIDGSDPIDAIAQKVWAAVSGRLDGYQGAE